AGNTDQGDETDIVSLAHIGESIVRGNDLALVYRHRLQASLDGVVQFLKALGVILGAALVVLGVGRIGLLQSFADITNIDLRQTQTLPGMRVLTAVLMAMVVAARVFLIGVLMIMSVVMRRLMVVIVIVIVIVASMVVLPAF